MYNSQKTKIDLNLKKTLTPFENKTIILQNLHFFWVFNML